MIKRTPCANEFSCICSNRFFYMIPRNCRRRSCMGRRVAMRAGHHICSNIPVATARLISSRSFVEKVPSPCSNASSGNSYSRYKIWQFPFNLFVNTVQTDASCKERSKSTDPQKRERERRPSQDRGFKSSYGSFVSIVNGSGSRDVPPHGDREVLGTWTRCLCSVRQRVSPM